MPIVYNGTTIKSLKYNGTDLKKVIYNGTTVMDKITLTLSFSFTTYYQISGTYLPSGYDVPRNVTHFASSCTVPTFTIKYGKNYANTLTITDSMFTKTSQGTVTLNNIFKGNFVKQLATYSTTITVDKSNAENGIKISATGWSDYVPEDDFAYWSRLNFVDSGEATVNETIGTTLTANTTLSISSTVYNGVRYYYAISDYPVIIIDNIKVEDSPDYTWSIYS